LVGLFFLLITVYGKVDPNSVSVSGLSSGAFFAVQYQLAHSSSIKGAAIFAGGPYYCAQGTLNGAILMCMNAIQPIPLATLEAYAQRQVNNGNLDGLGNLTTHNVYLFSGTQDGTVNPKVMYALEEFYQNLGVKNIVSDFDFVASHTFPTVNFGNACSQSFTPYISKCNFDGAGNGLNAIYGTLKSPVTPVASNIITFTQSTFTPSNPASLSLAATGYAYVPTNCQEGSETECKLHVAFHGCLQNAGSVQRAFVDNAGYNGWAEANDIIVLYPQTIASFFNPSNPNGCWDWWGYLNANYALKSGPQMQFIGSLINYFVQNH